MLEQAVCCLKSYNPVCHTVDSHAAAFLVSVKDPYEKVFIKQIFYGCVRYEVFLSLFCKQFFSAHHLNRQDILMYSIFAYLTYFRLDELRPDDFRKLLLSQEPHKMHLFLTFALDLTVLNGPLRQDWVQHYDHTYIDTVLIQGVNKRLPGLEEVVKLIAKKATQGVVKPSETAAVKHNPSSKVTV